MAWTGMTDIALLKLEFNQTTDDSLLKMLYLAMIDITKKWTGKRKDWGQIHSQLEIYFTERLPEQRKITAKSRVKLTPSPEGALDMPAILRYSITTG